MNDLSGFRPFSLRAIRPLFSAPISSVDALIAACQIKHLGYVELKRADNQGIHALAQWIVEQGDLGLHCPRSGTHPLQSGTLIERILAGDVLPEESFAQSIAEATNGAVLPDMFGLPIMNNQNSSVADAGPFSAAADEEASEPGQPPAPASAPHVENLPPIGALGGALPPGRLFHPIADARFPEGFVLTGCGVMLCLDESTAAAMRDALSAGIAHLRAVRQPRRAAA